MRNWLKWVLSFTLVCFLFIAHAQEKSIYTLYQEENYKEVISLGTSMEMESLKYADLVFIGLAAYFEHNDTLALTYFEKAVSKKPQALDARIYLAETYFNLEMYKYSVTLYRGAVKQKPYVREYYYGLIKAFFELNQPDSAMKYINRGYGLDPDDNKLHNLMGAVLRKKKLFPAAIEAYTKSINTEKRTKEEYLDALFAIATLEMEHGSVFDAKQAMDEYFRIEKQEVLAMQLMVQIYEAMGKGLKAKKHKDVLTDYYEKGLLMDTPLEEGLIFKVIKTDGYRLHLFQPWAGARLDGCAYVFYVYDDVENYLGSYTLYANSYAKSIGAKYVIEHENYKGVSKLIKEPFIQPKDRLNDIISTVLNLTTRATLPVYVPR